jgi:hypothetical protein
MMDATEGNHQGDRAMLGRAKLDRKHQSLLRARPCSWMPRACRGLGLFTDIQQKTCWILLVRMCVML